MAGKVDILAEEAGRLSASERIELINRLLDDLEPMADGAAAAWAKLAQERLESVRRGEMATLDADEALSDARKRLDLARRRRRAE